MATEIHETGITIDHDLGQVRLDTSDRAMASWAIRTGFQETTTRESHPYRRFVGTVRQVRLARPEKSLGRIAAEHRLREAMAAASSESKATVPHHPPCEAYPVPRT